MKAWIGLGSNIGDGVRQLSMALARLNGHPDIAVLRCSGFYQTPPWGNTNQDDFTNAVAEVETDLEPVSLLAALHEIERKMGRSRSGGRWGPRQIDLDLLDYGGRVVDEPGLVLPHPQMHRRAFVLVPLLELEPGFEIPGVASAAECLAEISDVSMERLARIRHQPS